MANNLMNTLQDVRNGSDEVTSVGCQIFGGHEKNRGSTVKDSLKQSRNKRYCDDS